MALQKHWATVAEQAKQCHSRLLQLNNVVVRPYKANGGCWLGRKWGLVDAIENELDTKDDCIYGMEHNVYFEALDKVAKKQAKAKS